MSKRNAKAERERQEKAALRRRILDIAIGAYGGYEPLDFDSDEFTGFAGMMGMDAFGRFVGGVKNALLMPDHTECVGPLYLENFDLPDGLVAFLWKEGVRA